ncbi:MAG: o-succinylbenzoate synthase [Microscillaceae bacterium]|nr:o-succinylbenzoate synthase [Microscillaceae bacterium]
MTLKATYQPHILRFRFAAGTSRGVMHTHQVYYLKVCGLSRPEAVGWGEAAPLPGLSLDALPDFEAKIAQLCTRLEGQKGPETTEEVFEFAAQYVPPSLPALRFALETALLDALQGGQQQLFRNAFSEGKQSLPINGLVWMGKPEFMQAQIEEKLAAGFHCLKLKIGAMDFEQELRLLAQIRQGFGPEQITLRVDANGAFAPSEALARLQRLSEYALHSIEQPIAPGQWEAMARLCAVSPVPIALDEELIGVEEREEKSRLLGVIKPAFIITKPTLLGGIRATQAWIAEAEHLGIGWWMTSALESNIGLNAIAQFTAQYSVSLPQGLGTGNLYHNNIASPLTLKGENLWYNPEEQWRMDNEQWI